MRRLHAALPTAAALLIIAAASACVSDRNTPAPVITSSASASRPQATNAPSSPLGGSVSPSDASSATPWPKRPTSPQATGFPRGLAASEVTSADPNNPDAIAKAFLQASFSWDCRNDEGPNAGGRRAAPLAAPALAAELVRSGGGRGPELDWRAMCDHDGYTTVAAEPANYGPRPPDTDAIAKRGYTVTITYRSADGTWTKHEPPLDFAVVLSREPGRWAVNSYKGIS